MTAPLARCSLCNETFPGYMEACPHCGAFRAQRAPHELAHDTTHVRNSGLAITGFVLSLVLWIIPIVGPGIAWTISFLGLRQTRDPEANRIGSGFAWAGLTLATIQLLLWLALFIVPMFAGETTSNPDGSTTWSFGDE